MARRRGACPISDYTCLLILLLFIVAMLFVALAADHKLAQIIGLVGAPSPRPSPPTFSQDL